jgi:hypothetical protein
MRLSFTCEPGQFTKAQLIAEQRLERAATGAIREAAELALAAGRKAIAGGGFSRRWQSALHAKTYPQSGTSLHPSAVIYDKIPYAGVFQTGATIAGHPLLWLPLDSAPMGRGGKRMSPDEFTANVGVLYSINHPGKPPLLAAVVRETAARAKKPASLSLLRRGRNPRGKGSVRLVPIFVGVPQVTDPQKFDVLAAVRSVTDQLPDLFAKYLDEV